MTENGRSIPVRSNNCTSPRSAPRRRRNSTSSVAITWHGGVHGLRHCTCDRHRESPDGTLPRRSACWLPPSSWSAWCRGERGRPERNTKEDASAVRLTEERRPRPACGVAFRDTREGMEGHPVARVLRNVGDHRILALAAGMTYYSLLAIFPALAALVAIYGLFADPGTIAKHLDQVSGFMPAARSTWRASSSRVSRRRETRRWVSTFIIGLAVSLWSANAAMKSLFDTLNIVYGEKEKRGFLKLNAISLGSTLAAIAFVLSALGAVVVLPVVLNYLWLSNFADLFVRIVRWPAMFLVVALALAGIYRFGPSREAPRWRWITWGSVAATILWLGASALFSWYAGEFRQVQRDLRLAGRSDRIYDVALDFGDRNPARGRARCRDGAPDRPRHHDGFAKADRHARSAHGRYGRRGARQLRCRTC